MYNIFFKIILFFLINNYFLFSLHYSSARSISNSEYQRMRIFSEVLSEIENKYVEKKSPQELINEALKGMVSSLDQHSSYLTPVEFNNLQIETMGNFYGIGIQFFQRNNMIIIISSIEGTPAFQVGLTCGDYIIKINDVYTKNMNIYDIIKTIRGAKDSKVTLTILRKGSNKLYEYILTRKIIPLHSVYYQVVGNNYGYIRISNFQDDTTVDLINTLKILQTEVFPLNGLILDLRNNPGGLLQEAVTVVDQIIKRGNIGYIKGRQINHLIFNATGQGKIENYLPIICLINNGSASASEIVAGAIQDNKQAIILGTTTFGKGSVQTIVPLGDKGALRLTTAIYYTPKGRAIQFKGIEPDLVIPFESYEIKSNNFISSYIFYQNKSTFFFPFMYKSYFQFENSTDFGSSNYFFISEVLIKDNQFCQALDLMKSWHILCEISKMNSR